jgi:ferritin-like metal-binding protein YciE
MSLATLHDLWVHELKDLYSAERQLVQALPKMAKAATSDALRTAFENHLSETEEHVSRIEQILQSFDESPKGQKCHGMEGLIDEGKGLLEEDADPDVLDAGIIVAAQKVEHYEIASYGAVCEYARIMGHTEALALLEQTLEEEKNADQLLNQLAEGGINALAERDANGAEEEEEADAPGNGSKKSKSRTQGNGGTVRSKGRSRASKARH